MKSTEVGIGRGLQKHEDRFHPRHVVYFSGPAPSRRFRVEFFPFWCVVAFPPHPQCGLQRICPCFVIWNDMMATGQTGLPEGDGGDRLKAIAAPAGEVSQRGVGLCV